MSSKNSRRPNVNASLRKRSLVALAIGAVLFPAAAGAEEFIEDFRLRSELLSEFWGRDTFIEAAIVLPPDFKAEARNLFCYNVHGFGGSHRSAYRRGPRLIEKMRTGDYPRMVYVYLNAQSPMGHHEFADSVNNGPWGRALTRELIPALEKKYTSRSSPARRFLTGHSSGGWSSLWLQVTYPDTFGGTWSTAPDSVDFRDFTGINVYEYENAYVDPQGVEIPLIRIEGEWRKTIREFVDQELEKKPYGGQFYSFDAVFSPRGEDGTPMPLFDRKTGRIDPRVAKAWEKYDISLTLRRQWPDLGPQLRQKIHVYMGTEDTFRLEGATRLLKGELEALGSDAEILLVEGRNHGTLFQPHPEHWPTGMMERIHREMWARGTTLW